MNMRHFVNSNLGAKDVEWSKLTPGLIRKHLPVLKTLPKKNTPAYFTPQFSDKEKKGFMTLAPEDDVTGHMESRVPSTGWHGVEDHQNAGGKEAGHVSETDKQNSFCHLNLKTIEQHILDTNAGKQLS